MGEPVDIPGEEYRSLRERLVTFFRMNGCADPEFHADEVVFRALRRLSGGAEVTSGLPAYCLGIARNVLKEVRKVRKTFELRKDPSDRSRGGFADLSHVEQKLLLADCLRALSPAERKLWLDYHLGDRQELAKSRNQSANALRIQIFRITRSILGRLEPETTREAKMLKSSRGDSHS